MVPTKVTYGNAEYAIYPFPAMTAAGISGDVARFAGPIVAGVAPILFDGSGNGKTDALSALMNTDIKDLGPMINTALSTLGKDNVQKILSELLLDYGNIAVEYRDETGKLIQCRLTKEVADEIFIGQLDIMFSLCIDVINLNYKGFFTSLIDRSGGLLKSHQGSITDSMENSTMVDTII